MIPDDVAARFWSKVDKNGPVHPELGTACWLWTAGKHLYGYGWFKHAGQNYGSHRFAWIVTNGPIPDGSGYHGTVIRHRCDNPACCNPAHLIAGSVLENNRDRKERNRNNPSRGATHRSRTVPESVDRGESHSNAKLTDEAVRTIRAETAKGVTYTELCRRFAVSRATVSLVARRKIWKHVV